MSSGVCVTALHCADSLIATRNRASIVCVATYAGYSGELFWFLLQLQQRRGTLAGSASPKDVGRGSAIALVAFILT